MTMNENQVSDNEVVAKPTGMIRIYTLSKQLNVDSQEILNATKQLGIKGKGTSLASLTDEETALVKNWLFDQTFKEKCTEEWLQRRKEKQQQIATEILQQPIGEEQQEEESLPKTDTESINEALTSQLPPFAREVLDTFETIATAANERRERLEGTFLTDYITGELIIPPGTPPNYLAHRRQEYNDYEHLCKEPAKCRFVRQGKTYYVSITLNDVGVDNHYGGYYCGTIGKWAEEAKNSIKNGENDNYTEYAEFDPLKKPDGWDSIKTLIRIAGCGSAELKSLRKLLDSKADVLLELHDDVSEEEEKNITYGIRRKVIDTVGYLGRPIAHPDQGKIFRMPIRSRLMILGAPGTGKTTTLIHRLAMNTNLNNVSDEERLIIESLKTEDHSRNWLMFTPTKLLQDYLKEAFNNANVPAPYGNVEIWSKHRENLVKNQFSVLNTPSFRNGFVLSDDLDNERRNIKEKSFLKTTEWYEDFDQWQCQKYTEEIIASVESLINTVDFSTEKDVCQKAVDAAEENRKYTSDKKLASDWLEYKDEFEEWFENICKLDTRLNRLKERKDMIDIVETIEIEQLLANINKAKKTFRKLLKDKNNAQKYADIPVNEIFSIKYYLDSIQKRYREFRSLRQKEGEWYQFQNENSLTIYPLELDIVLLAILRAIRNLLDIAWDDIDNNAKGWAALRPYKDIFRNQILVDEATDFSPVQLACMAALGHPRLNSFFACGDFNQSITTWGIRSHDELNWIDPGFATKELTVAYRQSQRLSNFAKALIYEIDGTEVIIDPFNENQSQEIKPALLENASEAEAYRWLADCICEIGSAVYPVPAIAVFVHSENEVVPVANALQSLLTDANIRVFPCEKGIAIGSGCEVRVFDIQHIKGLQFEAAFFVEVDLLKISHGDLFYKYLYVGATRAATYLGITCNETLPPPLDQLREHFCTDWKE